MTKSHQYAEKTRYIRRDSHPVGLRLLSPYSAHDDSASILSNQKSSSSSDYKTDSPSPERPFSSFSLSRGSLNRFDRTPKSWLKQSEAHGKRLATCIRSMRARTSQMHPSRISTFVSPQGDYLLSIASQRESTESL